MALAPRKNSPPGSATVSTIRRVLALLALLNGQGRLARTYGGAMA